MRKALIVLAGLATLSMPLLAIGCGDDDRDHDRREYRDRDYHNPDWDRDRDYHDRDWDRR